MKRESSRQSYIDAGVMCHVRCPYLGKFAVNLKRLPEAVTICKEYGSFAMAVTCDALLFAIGFLVGKKRCSLGLELVLSENMRHRAHKTI